MRNEPLLSWQWRLYRDGHRDRTNLAIHVATQPVFAAGAVALVAAPVASLWLFVAGPVAMAVAMALQGRGHSREATPPVPFSGPLDVFARIFAEQLITFPRFVLSGELARAWRAAPR